MKWNIQKNSRKADNNKHDDLMFKYISIINIYSTNY